MAKLPEKKSDAQQGEQLQDRNDACLIAKPGQTSVEQSDANPEVQPDPISEEELMGQPGEPPDTEPEGQLVAKLPEKKSDAQQGEQLPNEQLTIQSKTHFDNMMAQTNNKPVGHPVVQSPVQPNTHPTDIPEIQHNTYPDNQSEAKPQKRLRVTHVKKQTYAQLMTQTKDMRVVQSMMPNAQPEEQLVAQPKTFQPDKQLTALPKESVVQPLEKLSDAQPENLIVAQLKTHPYIQPKKQLTTLPEELLVVQPKTHLDVSPDKQLQTALPGIHSVVQQLDKVILQSLAGGTT